MTARLASDAEVTAWREDGWVLIEGLVGTEEIDAVAEDLGEIFPSPEELHADPEGVTERWRGHPVERKEVFVWPDEGPGFRPEQQRWAATFPFPGTGALNRLCVHPSLVNFAERALGASDIRLYQAAASAKYAGVTNYEQPMHIDRNHSWLPLGASSPGGTWRDSSTSPTSPRRTIPHASSRGATPTTSTLPTAWSCPTWSPASMRPSDPLRESGVRTWPTGPTVGIGEPPSARPPEPGSWPPSPSRTQKPNGSPTTPSSRCRRAWSGRSSSRARRRGSWRSSVGRRPGTRSGTSVCWSRPGSGTPRSTSLRGRPRSGHPEPPRGVQHVGR